MGRSDLGFQDYHKAVPHARPLEQSDPTDRRLGTALGLYAAALVGNVVLARVAHMSDDELGGLTAGETIAALAAVGAAYLGRERDQQ